MGDEAEDGFTQKGHSGNAPGGRGDEHSPLQSRAAFIENWSWESVISLNRGACERGRAQHGYNSETQEKARRDWEKTRGETLTLLKTLDFLKCCHRTAPFLFFNGNTFAEIARRLVDILFADLPLARRREAASLAAHYVAGVLDQDAMSRGIESLCLSADFKPGDRVKTLKGTMHGVVRKILPDGRLSWLPDTNTMELLALPESLLREEK
jgi:hypothetical protein